MLTLTEHYANVLFSDGQWMGMGYRFVSFRLIKQKVTWNL